MPLYHREVGALFGSSPPDSADLSWYYFLRDGNGGGAFYLNVGTHAVPSWEKLSVIGNVAETAVVSVAQSGVGNSIIHLTSPSLVELRAGSTGVGASLISGSADPSAGAGILASVPALYLRENSGVGELWLKFGASDTEWIKLLSTAAPTTADYLVGTAQAGLSAEIVVGTSPGGELGNTWASPTVDATHSGSSHAGLSGQPGSTDVAVADGGTGASTAAGARTNLDVPSNAEAVLDTLVDAKGDIIAATAADTVARLAVGANDQVLTADSAQATGLKWAAAGGGTLTIEDEGTPLATAATTLDFVGAGVIASGTGAEKTITIAGGGASTWVSLNRWGLP